MDTNNILNLIMQAITPNMWVTAVAVFGICFALKKASFFPDRFIPLAAVVLGIMLNIAAAAAFSRLEIVTAVIEGVICGMAAVYIANVIKQIKEGKKDEKDTVG